MQMKRLFAGLLLCLVLQAHTSAQLKTYLSLEAGPAWDISRVQDPGNMFSQSVMYSSVGGVSIWQEVLDQVSIGTGVYYHHYANGLNPEDQRPHQPSIKSYRSILIPARISYRIKRQDLAFSVTPRLGYQFGIVMDDPVLQNSSSTITDNDGVTMAYSLQESSPSVSALHLVEAGVSVDYRFSNNWQLSFAVSHFSGLSEVIGSEVDYQRSTGSDEQAIYTNDGSRFQTTFNLGIPVSNIWEKKEYRLQRRIENAFGRGGSVRKQRYIYIGGDLGSLWRSFTTTNPAVGARPIEGRGIFRYANLHTGGYIGYKFEGNTGIDVGAYYQRSSTFYSLMYDPEVDFVDETPAPMFLEFPIMIRYFYDLYKGKLFLVPSLGGSVITHFAAAGFVSGNGSFNYNTVSGPGSATFAVTGGRLARLGFTVRTGMALEYDLPIKFPLVVNAGVTYSHGFRDIDQVSITTSIAETPAESLITYDGTGWHGSVGIRMPFLLGKGNRKCGALPRIR